MIDTDYINIISQIVNNNDFQKLKYEKHHTINRFDHSLEVSYKTYKICKKLRLDYVSATKAALLHDYFFDEEFRGLSKNKKLIMHYKHSISNAKKITDLTKKEENIIASHMFPIGGKTPKYLESIIVDMVDDYVAIKENATVQKHKLRHAFNIITIIAFNFLTM